MQAVLSGPGFVVVVVSDNGWVYVVFLCGKHKTITITLVLRI